MKKRKPTAPHPLSPAQVDQMTDADLLVRIARESLVRHGTAIPPDNSRAGQKRRANRGLIPGGDQVDWTKEKKKCPQCGKTKTVDPDFGVILKRGLMRPQSWCRTCRSKTNYYQLDRKYTKHDGAPSKRRP